ncbi:MAG TPA: aromatic hydrocarbon degradation protein [Sulfurovum sp.]|nr:aromatic hydrocarbon degradation protein [Sulfurovum sp.]
MKTTQMTKIILLSSIAAVTLHATNGDNLIAIGTKARGMGGTSMAVSHGAESGIANAAMITTVEGTEITFGGTLFMPEIKTTLAFPNAPLPPQGNLTSDADTNMIPSVSIAHKINENWYVGVGMWGTAGMGTDYRGNQNLAVGNLGNMNMVTNLQLLQFAVPIAYKTGGLSLSIAPVMQYGNLDINYDGVDLNTNTPFSSGSGLAQDFGFGYNLGLAYDFTANGIAGLTLGAIYKSAIEMTYDGQLTTATAPFGLTLPAGDTLEQPAEYGVGIAYVTGQHTFAFDYKKIKWSEAKGYSDFGWEDSDVYAFGYQYAQDNWAVRVGYNYGASAVVEVADPRLNFFNLLGFPATAEKHYTLGGSYAFTDQFSLDLAYVYQQKNTETFSLQGLSADPQGTITTSHREDSVSFQLAYKF